MMRNHDDTRINPFRDVLVTGGTGFLGKVVLEELLRRREELGVGRVWLLVRPRGGLSPQQRLDAIADTALLRTLPPDWQRWVRVVPGDLALPDCGVAADDALRDQITSVIHCAASIKFDLPIAEAAEVNVEGTLRVLALARSMSALQRLVYVSTAYVTPHRPGPIPEEPVPMPLEPAEVLEAIRAGRAHEEALLAATGHPNTYTLTKCLAEHMLLSRRGGLPVSIVRPSIISATWRHPFPGWIDSTAALGGFLTVIGLGYMHTILADPSTCADIVPCDVVVDRIVDGVTAPGAVEVLHAVAGLSGAIPIDTIARTCLEFWSSNPLDRTARILYLGTSRARHRLHELALHVVPTVVAELWMRLRRRRRAARAARRLREGLATFTRVFPYFTHHTFDFRASRPLPGDFDRRRYLWRVCAGLYQHVLGRGLPSVPELPAEPVRAAA